MNKSYKLLKDTVNTKSGAIFTWNGVLYVCGEEAYTQKEVDNNPEWFAPVEEEKFDIDFEAEVEINHLGKWTLQSDIYTRNKEQAEEIAKMLQMIALLYNEGIIEDHSEFYRIMKFILTALNKEEHLEKLQAIYDKVTKGEK